MHHTCTYMLLGSKIKICVHEQLWYKNLAASLQKWAPFQTKYWQDYDDSVAMITASMNGGSDCTRNTSHALSMETCGFNKRPTWQARPQNVIEHPHRFPLPNVKICSCVWLSTIFTIYMCMHVHVQVHT